MRLAITHKSWNDASPGMGREKLRAVSILEEV